MTCSTRASLAVLAVSLGAGHAVHAQPSHGVDSLPGRAVAAAAVPADSARRGCLALGDSTWGPRAREATPCRARGIVPIGHAAGRDWSYGRYDRVWLLPGQGAAPPDTVRETEIVLFTQPRGAAVLAPVWHASYEPEDVADMRPQIAPQANGDVLVAIEQCWNGTGGCWQNFAVHRGGRWRPVHVAFLDSLERRAAGAINHGFSVDVLTLRASAAVYSPNDRNCCPSRQAEMRLRLRGDSLSILSLELRRLPP